jgi:hypothetical protein
LIAAVRASDPKDIEFQAGQSDVKCDEAASVINPEQASIGIVPIKRLIGNGLTRASPTS